MQSLPIYLYQNNLDVILDLDPSVQGVNQVMYQHDLKIQKGIKNKVRVQFKNSDQKRLPVSSTATYVFSMFDAVGQRQLIQKQIAVLDDSVTLFQISRQPAVANTLTFADASMIAVGQTVTGFGIPANTTVTAISSGSVTLNNMTTVAVSTSTDLVFNTLALRGVGELTFAESDTINLDTGSYTYSITYQDPSDGTYLPTYADTYYGVNGTLQLLDNVYPVLQPSTEISTFQRSFNSTTSLFQYNTRAVNAHPEYKSNQALHTVAYYMTNFIGTVYLQATLNNNPDYQAQYSTLETRTYNGFSGIDYINFNGLYSYIQVLFVPAKGPLDSTNDNPAYWGSFDKVVYRG